jgi:tRNA(Ile)-lysidine synthase
MRADRHGHTLDDQAETVLMRLVRGAGVRGLAAIRPRRRDGIVRPVIDCRRADLRAVVEQAGLPFRHDASNDDPRFLRTQVRQRVLPLLAELNPAVAEACANLAASARAEGAAAARWADAELAAAESEDGLPVAWLADQPAEARTLLARRWLVRAGLPRRRLDRRHVRAAVALALAREGRGEVHLPLGWVWNDAADGSWSHSVSLRSDDAFARFNRRDEPLPQDMCHVRVAMIFHLLGVM